MNRRSILLFFILFALELSIPSFRAEVLIDFGIIVSISIWMIQLLQRRCISMKIHIARLIAFSVSLIYVFFLLSYFFTHLSMWKEVPQEGWRSLMHAWYFLSAIVIGLSSPSILRFFSQLQSHPPRFITAIYVATALLSTLILVLPVSLHQGVELSYLDAFFTSVSALSGAGLTIKNTASSFSYFGEFILLIVIQAGGIGIITFSSILFLLIGKELGLRERVIQDDLERLWFFGSLKSFVVHVSLVVFVIEAVGAALIYPFMRGISTSTGEAIFHSVFHSVSSFCTAGFSTLPDGMVTADGHPFVLIVMGMLGILGMLGIPTIFGLIYLLKPKALIRRLSAYVKMELLLAIALMLFGTLSLFFVEMHNGIYSSGFDRLVDSFFQSSQRGGGFNSVIIADMETASIFILITLMMVAGAPMSTAGGLKTATIGVIIIFVISFLRGRQEASFAGRRLPPSLLLKAVSLLTLFMCALFLGFMALYFSETASGIEILFETVSALSLAGFSLGITESLTNFGKATVIILMIIGRIGILTAIYALLQGRKPERYRYPIGDFHVG